MRSRVLHRAALAALLLFTVGPVAAESPSTDQLAHGKRLFLYCSACHTVGSGEPDKVGPNLHGVVGATAGTRGSYAYSAALKGSAIVWSAETLDTWLKQPTALVPGTKMTFAGLPKPEDRTDVIAYLTAASHEREAPR